MARTRKAAKPIQAATDATPDIELAAAQEAAGSAARPGAHRPEQPAREVNPFPPIIKTAVLGDGYTIRLQQSQDRNEVQIKFGDGTTGEKPSDAVRDFIKQQVGPNGTKFRWNDEDRAWGMPIRDPVRDPNLLATREKARQVFNKVVEMVAQERGTGRTR